MQSVATPKNAGIESLAGRMSRKAVADNEKGDRDTAVCRSLYSKRLLLHSTVSLPALILLVQLLGMLQEKPAGSSNAAAANNILLKVTSTLADVSTSCLIMTCTCCDKSTLPRGISLFS